MSKEKDMTSGSGYFNQKLKTPSQTDTKKAKSDITSPNYRDAFTKVLGGLPEKKDVEQVDKVNQPSGRKRAPGACRF